MSAIRAFLVTMLLLCASGPGHAELLSPADAQAYRSAFAAARSSDWSAARRSADEAKERLPAKIVRWIELTRSGAAAFADIVEFADGNPDWPLQTALRLKAEDASDGIPDDVLLPYFKAHHPTTPRGRLRFAEMLATTGQQEAATGILRELWLSPDLDPDTEKAILERHAGDLRPEEHVARLDRLIWDGMESAARRQLQRVPEDQRRLGEARLGLAALLPSADDLVAQVPQYLQGDSGLLLERARWSRRKDFLDQAAAIILSAPRDHGRPSAWWTERYVVTRRLLDEQKNQLAYDLISRHGQAEGTADYAEAEFFAGWVALRKLNDPGAALAHFTRLFAAVKQPISLARGAYWAGRAAESMERQDTAADWLTAAAKYGTTYYGQLAAARLGKSVVPEFPPEPRPSADETAAFERRELVKAVHMLSEINESDVAKPFLFRLHATAKTPTEYKLVAALAESAGRPDVAIAAAKQAGSNGLPLLADGFPVIPLPRTGGADASLVLAITRQESAFDVSAISRSDARGLMQLKPSTAKQVAKSLEIPFAPNRLVTDAGYNLTLGRAYLDKMLDTFGGSYVLAVAAYNAGPARVTQWLGTHGDPRNSAIDVIDWIELIPFNETRNYVQRVLENLQVYRLRLADRTQAFTLARDLRR